MSKKSPMSLSLDYLNKLGYSCQIVERWIPGANIRQDCFGFADILAYHKSTLLGIALVQTTSAANFMARRTKILRNPHREPWHRAGGHIWLHGWGEKGLREEEL